MVMRGMTRDDEEAHHLGGLIVAGLSVLTFIILAFSSYYTVDQGYIGVVTRNGAVVNSSGPGLHFKLPIIDSVDHISMRPQLITFEGQEGEEPALQAYSQDQQPATIQVAVNYHATDAVAVYSQYGGLKEMESRLIVRRVFEQVKNIFGQFTAISAVQNRTQFNARVSAAILNGIRGPLVVDGVQIVDITFSKEYEAAVEQRMQAIIAQERAIAEKQQRITNADAAAYEVKAKADAQAHATTVNGDAEAHAIAVKGQALRDNPQIVALTTAQAWDGKLPETMVPNGGLPFLDVTKK